MKATGCFKSGFRALAITGAAGFCLIVQGCSQSRPVRVQGYVEGEFVYVSSQVAGPLNNLSVQRGSQVRAGEPLYTLDDTVEKAVLVQATASLSFSEADFERQQKLSLTPGSTALRDLELARSERDQDQQRVAQAKWNYEQKHQVAPEGGLVFDTLYRAGEWVQAGRPVIQLLPPQNITVRAFVPENKIATLRAGDRVQVVVDGMRTPLVGTLDYIFPRSEYTPPVIYSNETRDKLVYMVEVRFDPALAAQLHPGQPVDVVFGAGRDLWLSSR